MLWQLKQKMGKEKDKTYPKMKRSPDKRIHKHGNFIEG
jgi:hypothetical protein